MVLQSQTEIERGIAAVSRNNLDPQTLLASNEALMQEATLEAVGRCPDFMSVEQVAAALQLSRNTVRTLLHQKVIPGKKLSHKWVIPREALTKALIDG